MIPTYLPDSWLLEARPDFWLLLRLLTLGIFDFLDYYLVTSLTLNFLASWNSLYPLIRGSSLFIHFFILGAWKQLQVWLVLINAYSAGVTIQIPLAQVSFPESGINCNHLKFRYSKKATLFWWDISSNLLTFSQYRNLKP